jgi:hypothetical protein
MYYTQNKRDAEGWVLLHDYSWEHRRKILGSPNNDS